MNVPYRFDNSITVEENSEVTIEPGAVFEFYPERRLSFEDNTEIQMLGAARDKTGGDGRIIFCSAFPGETFAGVKVRTNRAQNELRNVVIDGGGGSRIGNGKEAANLVFGARCDNPGHVSVTNVALKNSPGTVYT